VVADTGVVVFRRVALVVVLSLVLAGVPTAWVVQAAWAEEAAIDAARLAVSQSVTAENEAPASTSSPEEPSHVGQPAPGAEIVELRDEFSKTVQGDEPDERRLVVSAEPMHVQDEDGDWKRIDLSLHQTAEGLEPVRAPVAVTMADRADEAALASVAFEGGESMGFALAEASGAPAVVEESSANYQDALEGVDVRLSVVSGGVKELLILDGPQARRTFDFPLNLDGLSASLIDGAVELTRPDGSVAAMIPHGWMHDSAPVDDGRGERSDGVGYQLLDGADGTVLRVTLDPAWLDDDSRVWPVTVDPSVVAKASDTYIDEAAPSANFLTDSNLLAGTTDGGYTRRTLLRFDLAPYQGLRVDDARVRLYNWGSQTCSGRRSALRRVTSTWTLANVTWNNQPSSSGFGVRSDDSFGFSSACPNNHLFYSGTEVTQAFQYWLGDPRRPTAPTHLDSGSQDWQFRGFQVQAGKMKNDGSFDEGDETGRKSFASLDTATAEEHAYRAPKLLVDYHVGAAFGSEADRFSYNNPTVKVDAGTATSVTFTLQGLRNQAAVGSPVSATPNSSGVAQTTFSALADGWYRWKATSQTGAIISDWRSFEISTPRATVHPSEDGQGNGIAPFYTLSEHKLDATTTLGVNVGSGNLFVRSRDVSQNATGLPFRLDRVYNSVGMEVGDIGRGWGLGPGRQVGLFKTAVGNLMFEDPTGARHLIEKDFGEYTIPASLHDAYALNFEVGSASDASDDKYLLKFRNGTTYRFTGGGSLDRISDRFDNRISLTYDTKQRLDYWTDADSRVFDVEYDIASTHPKYAYCTPLSGGSTVVVTDPANRFDCYKIDAAGDLRSWEKYFYGDDNQDGVPNTTPTRSAAHAYDYDSAHKLVTITDGRELYGANHDGAITQIDYRTTDWRGHAAVAAVRRRDITGSISSNDPLRATEFTYTEPTTGKFKTDVKNDLTAADPRGATTDPVTTYEGDLNDRPMNYKVSKTTDPFGHERSKGYDALGNVNEYTSADQSTALFNYNPSTGNLDSIESGEGGTAAFEYTDAKEGNQFLPTQATSPNGVISGASYGTKGELTTAGGDGEPQWDVEYRDANNDNVPDTGQIKSITSPKDGTTTFDYDTGNRLQKITPPTTSTSQMGDITLVVDHSRNVVTQTTDGRGLVTKYLYDAFDRPTQVTFGAGTTGAITVTMTYDLNGNRITMDDGTLTQLHNTAFNQLDDEQRGSSGKHNLYEYDDTGNLIFLDTLQGEYTYTFDKVNRVTSMTEPDPDRPSGTMTTVYGYDKNDRRTCTSFAGRVEVIDNQNVEFDAVEEHRVYDRDGHVTRIMAGKRDTNRLKCVDDDPNNPSHEVVYTGGTAASDPTSYAKGLTTTLTKFRYFYDAGRLDRSEELDGPSDTALNRFTQYGYDSRGRLSTVVATSADGGAGTPLAYDRYVYDVDGNIESHTTGSDEQNATETTYTNDSADRLIYVDDPDQSQEQLHYDGAGNLTSGQGWTYQYDAANRTTSAATPGGLTEAYTYAGTSTWERLSVESSDNMRDRGFTDTLLGTASATFQGSNASSQNQVYTRDADGTLNTVTKPDPANSDRWAHPLTDRLGTVVKMAGPQGGTAAHYRYTPYGERTQTTGTFDQPYGFTGAFTDDTGQNKLGHRYQRPDLARWTQPDPSGRERNRYQYAGSNPANLTDPSGLDWADTLSGVLDGAGDADLIFDLVGAETTQDYALIAATYLFEAAVTATCVAAVIGVTAGIGSVGALGCAALGAAAGQGIENLATPPRSSDRNTTW
jgi:RHS repeat-associated protein